MIRLIQSRSTAIIALMALVTAINASCNSTGKAAVNPSPSASAGAVTTDAATRDALLAALDDERRAEATYAAIIIKFGEVRPFSNIVHAEVRHQSLLLPLLDQYGISTPPNPYSPATISVPVSMTEACAVGVQSERDNIAMYDRLLPKIEQQDIRSAFETLRSASADRHLLAFERCANRGGGPRRGST